VALAIERGRWSENSGANLQPAGIATGARISAGRRFGALVKKY